MNLLKIFHSQELFLKEDLPKIKFRIMLRGTVKIIALGLSLLILTPQFGAQAFANPTCESELIALTPHLKNYNQENYEKSFHKWNIFFRERTTLNEADVLSELKSNHPAGVESLLAMADALNPNYDWSLSRHLSRYPQIGLSVVFRTEDISQVDTRLSYSKRQLIVKWPREGTQSLGQILRDLRAFSRSIADFYTLSVARKGEFFRLPLSKNTRTYAARVADAYTQGELHFYSVVRGLKKHFPQYPIEWEAAKDTLTENPAKSYMHRILMLVINSNYKFYLKHVWNQADYESFERLLLDAQAHEKNLFEVEAGYRKQVIAPRILAHAQIAQNHRVWRPIVTALAAALLVGGSWTYAKLNPPFPDPMATITQTSFKPVDIEKVIKQKEAILSNEDKQTLRSLLEMWRSDSSGIKRAVIENQISQIFESAELRAAQKRPPTIKPHDISEPQTLFDAPLK